MAEFDPYAPNMPQGNYLGYSRGSQPSSDVASNTLFGDVGNIIQGVSRGVSQYFQQSAREQYTAGADYWRDVLTGRADVPSDTQNQSRLGITGPQGREAPTEVTEWGQRLQALRTAYQSGRLNESYYWMMLDMEARQVRQRYPGFRAEIDNMISDVTGGNPANHLVTSLRHEAMQAGNREQQNHEHWVREATNWGTPSALNYQTLAQQGRPPSTLQLQQEVAQAQQAHRARERDAAQLTIQHQQGVNVTEQATRSAISALDVQARNVWNTATGPLAQQRGEFERNLANAQTAAQNGTLQPAQIQQLAAQWNALRPQYLANANAFMHAPSNPNDPTSPSWYTLIGNPERANGVVAGHMQAFDAIASALGNPGGPDFNLLNYFKRTVETTEQGNIANLYQRSDTLLRASSLRHAMGPQWINVFMRDRDGAGLSSLVPLISSAGVGMATGNENLGSILGRVSPTAAPQLTPDQRNGVVREVLNDQLTFLGTRELPMEQLRNSARALFGQGNENVLQSFSNRSQVFMQLAGSPDVVANLVRLRDSGEAADRQLYTNFHGWVTRNFAGLMRESAETMQGIVMNSTNAELRFDPATYTFSLVPRDNTGNSPGPSAGQQQVVNNVNNTLMGLSALVNATEQNPQARQAIMTEALRGLSLDLNRANRGSVAGNMWERMINSVTEAIGDPGGRRYGPGSQRGAEPHQVAPMLDVIGRFEAGQHGYESVYGGRHPGLNNMSIQDVRSLMDGMVQEQAAAGRPRDQQSSAVGRYQFTRQTFDELVQRLGLNPEAPFNNATQDRMATELLRQAGLEQFLANPTPQAREQLINRIAGRWAAIPNTSGVSAHQGVGNNRANPQATAALNQALDDLIRQYGRRSN